MSIKIHKIYLEKGKGGFAIMAHVRKYSFGFLVDFWEEQFCSSGELHHTRKQYRYWARALARPIFKKYEKQEADSIVKILRSRYGV